jgi:hypothetical protein
LCSRINPDNEARPVPFEIGALIFNGSSILNIAN